jgi:hypothetical protein
MEGALNHYEPEQHVLSLNANSEKYVTEKLEKEFREILKQLKLTESVTREEVFELLVKMGYLKSVDQLKSIYVAEENI